VCDLGSDKVYVVTYSEGDGWNIVSTYETSPRYGPRHAAIRPSHDGTPALVYIVNELASVVTTHHILSNPTRVSEPVFSPVSTLPESMTAGYVPEGPMETIACAILLLHHPGGQDELIVTNRNLPASISSQLDPWTSFPVSSSGDLGNPEFHFGAGRHLRGIGYDTRDQRLLVASREGDGFALYKKDGEEWIELGTGLLASEGKIEFPLAIDWL
jgi:6-phosphogluconolactonase (cycloisomerase 2 family)